MTVALGRIAIMRDAIARPCAIMMIVPARDERGAARDLHYLFPRFVLN